MNSPLIRWRVLPESVVAAVAVGEHKKCAPANGNNAQAGGPARAEGPTESKLSDHPKGESQQQAADHQSGLPKEKKLKNNLKKNKKKF